MDIKELHSYFLECDIITTDSREVKEFVDKGKKVMFFALKGENFDGNKFVLPSLSMGAKYAIADDNTLPITKDILFTDNVLKTLTELATYHRQTLSHTHLAITGSNGKTTTKELILAVLSKKFRCHATVGNLNNHIGVPLTILRTPKQANFSIIEMGANHKREIAQLCEIAMPTCGIITNIGKAHLEGFGGNEGVKKGKGELFDYLEEHQGTAFYLAESSPLSELIQEHPKLLNIEYTITDILEISSKERLSVQYNNETIESQLVGDYNIYNIRAAIAIGEYFEVSAFDIKEAIEGYIPNNNRSQLIERKNCRLVVDAYNANPSSMDLSISNFDSIDAPSKVIILGDMKELGEFSLEEHITILKLLENLKSKDLEFFFVGDEFHSALTKYRFKHPYKWFKDALSMSEQINNNNYDNKLILIKGSNSTRLSSLIECF